MKVVLQETGMKADTLRAWERRYGMPMPLRSEGGHRLYSRHDIDVVKWLLARQGEGLSISRAIALWQSLEESGEDPLTSGDFRSRPEPAQGTHIAGSELDDLRLAWLDACLEFDEQLAEQTIAQAFAQYPVDVVCLEIFQKSLAKIGELWYRGAATVQQEHFTSSLIDRHMESLIASTSIAGSRDQIVVACPPGEEHSFSALFLTLIMRRAGHKVVYLGTSVPIDRLVETTDQLRPDLMVSIAMRLTSAAEMLKMAVAIRSDNLRLAFGGRIFSLHPDLSARIPGFFLGDQLEHAEAAIERILNSRPSQPEISIGENPLEAVLSAYQTARGRIEIELAQRLAQPAEEPSYFSIADRFFSDDLEAALVLGDLGLLEKEVEWVAGLLEHQGISGARLVRYLEAYRGVLSDLAGDDAAPILDCLGSVLAMLEE